MQYPYSKLDLVKYFVLETDILAALEILPSCRLETFAHNLTIMVRNNINLFEEINYAGIIQLKSLERKQHEFFVFFCVEWRQCGPYTHCNLAGVPGRDSCLLL